ncbi:MAG TPA: M48 family peptidase [Hellea balneolensis]|uniref:M48 family peptidase n=1 Tax=Hellea balneolensis TaxID=287478 RepID=A0A7C5QWB1_9PROT|nr:M48 family peptidase [Hellea balneolensis]
MRGLGRGTRRGATGRRTLGRRGGGFRWKIMLIFAIGAGFYYMANQKTVPFTGRKQLRTMKPAQEMQLGLQSYKRILSDSRGQVQTRGPIVDKVREIGYKLARAAKPEDPGFEWAFNVIDSRQVNAFALPGGYTAVYTGIIPVAANDDGLAAIMGHEIGHALAHHGSERMAQQNFQRIVGAGVSVSAGGMDVGAQRAVMGVFGGISKYGYALPFSRSHESEADYIGLILMARACYDPREAPRLWQRMKQASGGRAPPEFSSTHPSAETRIAQFQKWMGEAIDVYNQHCPTPLQ